MRICFGEQGDQKREVMARTSPSLGRSPQWGCTAMVSPCSAVGSGDAVLWGLWVRPFRDNSTFVLSVVDTVHSGYTGVRGSPCLRPQPPRAALLRDGPLPRAGYATVTVCSEPGRRLQPICKKGSVESATRGRWLGGRVWNH